MNKKIIGLAIFVGLFCFASLSLGQITNPIGASDFSSLFKGIAVAVGKLVAGLAAIMVIVAGIIYLTSVGSPERVGLAKKALTYAIIGAAIALAAEGLVTYVAGLMKS
jgi:hypothetical protein